MRLRKRTLYFVCGRLFTLRICNIRRGKSFSRIFVQFPHEPSTTMFVLIKNLHFMVEFVQEKLYFSNVGQKKSFILPRIIVYTLKHTTHTISFTFDSLAIYCSSIVPRLIRSTKFHQNNTQTQRSSMIDRKKYRAHLH